MRKTKRTIITLLLVTLLGSLLSGSALAKEIKTEKELRVDNAGIQALTELVLLESENQTSWSVVDGTLAVGYTMGLNPALEYEYLDAQSVVASPALADGVYGFVLDPARVPADFYPYWAAKGVVDGVTGDLGILWNIITGESPMFYLKVSSGGTAFDLLDGFLYQASSGALEAPLRVNGDYPVHTYNFEGTVQDTGGGSQTFVVGITFTRQATVSIVGDTFTIDGCGYIDLYILVANAINLYALDVSVEFDEKVVEVIDLDPVATGVNLEPVDGLFDGAYWVYNQADNSTGAIRYAATQYRPSAPMTGSDYVAKIRLRAKAIGTSPISVTGATLSDRDGYLVGVPLVLDTADVITTRFTATGGLDLGIVRSSPSTVRLNWPKQTMDAGVVYKLYRSTLPYFDIEDTGIVIYTTGFSVGENTVTFDDQVLGRVGPEDPEVPEPNNNYFYAYGLQIVCSNEFTSPLSDQVGKIEFELFETNTTDFSWIGLVLGLQPKLTTAQDLADHIEANSTGELTVKTVSEWDAESQNYNVFYNEYSFGDFGLSLKHPYQIEIELPGTTNSSTIWAQVGPLPQITTDDYLLYETNNTDFTWLLQPLDYVSINYTIPLALDIENKAGVNTNVLTISEWDAESQNYNVFYNEYSFGDFSTRFGYPYQVEVKLSTVGFVTWP